MKIYTIGYGGNTKIEFLKALEDYNIGVLVDIRSKPYSRYQEWTNKADFKEWLNGNDISYVHKVKLGGMPLSSDEVILEELRKLEKAYEDTKEVLGDKGIAVMCSEANPDECHRKKDIARVGEANGFEFEHIIINERLKEKKRLEDVTMAFDFGN